MCFRSSRSLRTKWSRLVVVVYAPFAEKLTASGGKSNEIYKTNLIHRFLLCVSETGQKKKQKKYVCTQKQLSTRAGESNKSFFTKQRTNIPTTMKTSSLMLHQQPRSIRGRTIRSGVSFPTVPPPLTPIVCGGEP